jgi:tripartite-type tricarboxylate transporter receptor subunit TctC
MAVTSALPVADLREFVAYAKARPDELTYATLGPTTAQSLAMQMFMQRTGIKLREVPYKSSSQILTDVAAGRVDMTIDNVANVLPAVRGSRVRPLAVSTGKRMDVMPDVPTISESVAPGFQVASWVGLVAPAGVPPDIVATISSALLKALDSAEYKQWLHNNGAQPPEHPEPGRFGEFIESELKLWRSAADLAGVPAVK